MLAARSIRLEREPAQTEWDALASEEEASRDRLHLNSHVTLLLLITLLLLLPFPALLDRPSCPGILAERLSLSCQTSMMPEITDILSPAAVGSQPIICCSRRAVSQKRMLQRKKEIKKYGSR